MVGVLPSLIIDKRIRATITPSMLTRRSNPLVYYTRGEHANHYTIDVDPTLESLVYYTTRGFERRVNIDGVMVGVLPSCIIDKRIRASGQHPWCNGWRAPLAYNRQEDSSVGSNPLVYYTRGEHANH
jgi:hypothetical protein